jgi:RNase P subunit RPR2
MVRVVEQGPDPSAVKRVVCRSGCGAVLEYVPNDIQERRQTDYTGSTDTYRVVACPSCGKDVKVGY